MAHPKGQLIERLAKLGVGKPEYRTVNTGPGHQPTFLTDVLVDGEVYGTGQGSTKREAERLASEEALEFLERDEMPPSREERASSDEPFDGPWPIFENVLEAVIEVANERVDEELTGEEARVAIRDFTLGLYKEILENLGEVVEEVD